MNDLKPISPNAKYLESKGWLYHGAKETKSGHTAYLWIDPISKYEFIMSQAVEWQRKRDSEPELPGISE